MHSRRSCIALLMSLACFAPACASSPDTGWSPPDPEDTVAPAGSPVDLHGQLKVEGSHIVDKNGQPVQLKGLSSMWLNYESIPFSGSKKALAFMRDKWKLQVIRAAMGTDPTPAPSSVTKVHNIIRNALALGVYVIVDWHTEKAVDQRAAAVAFFSDMAAKYGEYPNVIWETYNEPKGYDWVNTSDPSKSIKTYHQAVVDAIREKDPDNIIVLGTPNYSQRVDIAAADPVAGTNLAYTVHFYSCTHQAAFRDMADKAMAAGAAIFITEFGATDADGGLPSPRNHYYVCADEATEWFDWMAENKIGGVAWKLDIGADASCILKSGASENGPWPDEDLSTFAGGTDEGPGITGGHGLFVVNWLRQ
jgi:endoglucanase